MSERALSVFSPAKINLLLAITGRRADGFHELVSVVAPLTWGDDLRVERADGANETAGGTIAGEFSLVCEDPAVPRDATNLVLKAAAAFAAATPEAAAAVHGARFRFILEKRIPIGAGLGGGSSNAAAALQGLNRLAGEPLDAAALARVAATVGSDCALFLHDAPVVMRGRGERVEPLALSAATRLRGRRLLVFKPAFGISTAWAYGKMAESAPGSYLAPANAEERVKRFVEEAAASGAWEQELFNNMESVAFAKFPALPVLLEKLQRDHGLAPRMSGSGSACFAFLDETTEIAPIAAMIRAAWGESVFVRDARLR